MDDQVFATNSYGPWTWDTEKYARNRNKHRVRFETAVAALDDPLSASRDDPHPDGDRIETVALVGWRMLVIVHTWPDTATDQPGRIISARSATKHEREFYQEG